LRGVSPRVIFRSTDRLVVWRLMDETIAQPLRFEADPPRRLQEMVYRSWERIFDLDALNKAARADSAPYTPQRAQLTFEEIRIEDAVKAEHFCARGEKRSRLRR
jgi:hypothetical protein